MQDWHAMFLGRRRLARDLSAFELEAFFTFMGTERRAIEEPRQPALKLGLALQMGFLHMTGRPLEAIGAVRPALWQHLGAQLQVTAPDLASLRVMYRRLSTLYEHQDLAREVLGFRKWPICRIRHMGHYAEPRNMPNSSHYARDSGL